MNRAGEKIGWTAGWLGGFLWVAILALVFLYQGLTMQGLSGIALACAAVAIIAFFTPWRYPATPYWKLMLAPYGMFFLAAAWGVWVFGGLDAISLTWWNALWFLPAMIPLVLFSRKTWAGYSPKR